MATIDLKGKMGFVTKTVKVFTNVPKKPVTNLVLKVLIKVQPAVPGAMIGGLALGVMESFGALAFGPEHAVTLSFIILILFLLFRPTGIMGKRGYE